MFLSLQDPPKDQPASLETRGRKRQLELLHYHGVVLLSVLTSSMELEGSRSSKCSHMTLSPIHHEDISSSFYPVLKQTQDVLNKVCDIQCACTYVR